MTPCFPERACDLPCTFDILAVGVGERYANVRVCIKFHIHMSSLPVDLPRMLVFVRTINQVAAIMVSRFVCMPMIAVGMLVLGSGMELMPSDKLIWFVLLMQA